MFQWLCKCKPRSLNWKYVNKLVTPLQTTRHDIIFSGRGRVKSNGYTRVPGNVEVWLLAPGGSSVSEEVNNSLLKGLPIVGLGIATAHNDTLINSSIHIYCQGELIPDYILESSAETKASLIKATIITVESPTKLSELFMHLLPVMEPGKIIRCFWSLYTNTKYPGHPVVYHL